jgi:uncharacterized repeat protein (TIGR03847 family)
MGDEAQRADLFTVDYSGEPGHRSFYLQVRFGDSNITLAVEKQQVALLAEKLTEMLLLIDATDPIATLGPQRLPSLEAIFADPVWHVGAIGLSYDDDADLVSVDIREAADDVEEALEEGTPSDGGSARLLLQRSQVRDFVVHALAVVQEGRPMCPLCGLPIDPDGHACPATNGHHPAA